MKELQGHEALKYLIHRRNVMNPESTPYYLTRRFSTESSAGRAYRKVERTLFNSNAELSVYRFQLNGAWHVTVVGEAPDEEFQKRLQSALAGGQAVTLEEEVLSFLLRRREESKRSGDWVERHYRPGRRFEL